VESSNVYFEVNNNSLVYLKRMFVSKTRLFMENIQ
jgi:hypothetical protein